MGSFIPADKVVRVSQRLLNTDGRIAQSSCYLQYTGSAPAGVDLTALAGASVDAWFGLMASQYHSSWSSDVAVCTDLTSTTSATGEASSPSPGTLTGGRLPANVAMVISNTIPVRYRGGHPRVYLPVGDDTKLLTDAEWTSAFVSSVTSQWASYIAQVALAIWSSGGTFTQVAPSFYDGFTNEIYGSPPKYRRVPTPRSSAVVYPVITQVGRSVLGSQRRRLRTAG